MRYILKSFGVILWFISIELVAQEPSQMVGIVERHNFWRNEFALSPLKWSNALAENAQKWANQLQEKGCIMKHSNTEFGENIFWASGGSITPTYVVDSWAEEKANFNFSTFKCNPGTVCGHYTQVIWENTKEVGCAVAICGNQQIWVCQYNPAGNWIGQKPFNK